MYARIDDRFFSNPKVRAAGTEGALLYLSGLCHCASHLTDGFIRADMLAVIAAEAQVPQTVAERLVEVHLWIPADGGWAVHDYLEQNQSKAQVEATRKKDRERKAKARSEATEASGADSARTAVGTSRGVQSGPVLVDGKPSSSSVLPVDSFDSTDDEDEVFEAIADLRLAKAKTAGTIKSSAAGYRRSTRANLPAEVGPRVRELIARLDEPARTIAEVVENNRDTRLLRTRSKYNPNPIGAAS